MACSLAATCAKYKPHLGMVLTQFCSAIVYFITEAAFNEGLNPHVYVTYRLIVAGSVMIPFAYFLERKSRPKLTLAIFLELLLVSLIGIVIAYNMYFISMRCTSPTFVTSVFNTVPSVTFLVAILLRMEIVDVRSLRGIAKILGTVISLGGVMVITLYRGPSMPNLWDAPIHMKRVLSIRENWVLGSTFAVISCITWSLWFIMQAHTLKKYPAKLSLTAWFNCIGAAQSALFAVTLQHKPKAWSITMFGTAFWAIVYSGIIGTALVNYIQLWCVKVKGPVFVAVFNPLQTVITALLAYFVFGEKMYTGSILGGVTVIIGLYVQLWGKGRDQSYTKSPEQSSSPCDEIKAAKNDVATTEKLAEP